MMGYDIVMFLKTKVYCMLFYLLLAGYGRTETDGENDRGWYSVCCIYCKCFDSP